MSDGTAAGLFATAVAVRCLVTYNPHSQLQSTFEIQDYLSPDGVDLRVDRGPVYRVYYAQAGKRLILLLAGGDKRKQAADIESAIARWNDWQQRRKAS